MLNVFSALCPVFLSFTLLCCNVIPHNEQKSQKIPTFSLLGT